MIFNSKHFAGNGRLAQAAHNNPPLKRGNLGRAIRLLQQALIDLGYPLPISTQKFGSPDGLYGNELHRKVRQFQIDEELDRDGQAGEQTIGRLDKLLKDRSIPFLPLTPLPPGSPGDTEISGLNEMQIMLRVLSMGILKTINFELHWNQSYTRAQQFLNNSQSNTASSIHVNGFSYTAIANAISNEVLLVEIDPAISHTMLYDYKGKKFTIQGTLTVDEPRDLAMVVHEATHAILDFNNIGLVESHHNEAVAFVAGSLFYRKVLGTKRTSEIAHETAVLDSADAIAQTIIKGSRVIKADDPDVEALSNALIADPGHKRAFNQL